MIIVSALTIVIAYLYNRFYFILVSALSLTAIALSTYLNFRRPIFRALITFLFSTVIILFLLVFDKTYLRKTNTINSFANNKKVLIVGVLFSIVFSVLCSSFLWIAEVKSVDNKDISGYIRNNQDKVSISSIWQCYDFNTNALLFNDIPDNVIVYGWLDGSEYDNDVKKRLNINNLYKDMLARDDLYITTNVKSYLYIEKYYKEHFDKKIKLEFINTFDTYGVYSIKE